ncbi:magnesium transporter NIPA-domain-containing protein [Halteromyces radiatus]|uniref:magnesium transporter NIPA-domain-containing protein n=1 Tax=Halteromyces radiatus TaxID=101107 RepID=UPI0022203DCE|nr:magnesium transporter NIPA-domain-containing protein [Halteromyces radiatus]KAI8099831.1 magnesium transporter NIPA-domain-containing protein [Halteromyces radiatus]
MMAGENAVNFVIGVFVSLGASFMDALGLNILKLDHVKEGNKPTRRGDCGRPLWHIGLYTYVASQLIGSTIALNYLKTQWVAPLGSVALIYNFIFAKILVGTNITRKDVFGTLVVVASVIWIVVFGGMYNGEDPEASISLENLKTLFTRPIFIIYFSALNIVTFSGLAFAIWSRWAISDQLKRPVFVGMTTKKMRRMVGLMFSLDGGLLASETLLLAKSGVKLFTLSVNSQVNQFTDNTSRFIILALIITAILQVYCLNTALKLYTSVVVVPVFYGTYTAVGLVNTIIYLDEIGNYPGWAISLVFVGISVLVYGVYLLSSKPDPTSHSHDDEDDDDDNDTPQIQRQQVVVIVPLEQEMHAISSTSTSANSPTSSRPPVYSSETITLTNNYTQQQQQQQQYKTNVPDEKHPYSFPSTALTKTISKTISSTTATAYEQQQQQQQQRQPFGSTRLVDEAIYEHNHDDRHHRTSSSNRWIQRLLSKTPWRTFQHHRREDTFLSLHSTETNGSLSLPHRPVDIIPTKKTDQQCDTTSLTRRVQRTSQLSDSSDPQLDADDGGKDRLEK